MKRFLPIVILFVFFLINSCVNEEKRYDKKTHQKAVLTKKGIDSVLNSFETIKHTELDPGYLSYSDPEKKFQKQLKGGSYYIIKGEDVYKFVVGKYRIKNFIAHDGYEENLLDKPDSTHKVYWLIDKKVLYMLLEFIQELDKEGYNKYGFIVREGHRHPQNNTMKGGASKSQHIYGKAIDLVIMDVNNDGKADQKDKEICLEIAERVVGSKGGVGRYPGTMTIHIDSRGKRARWDSY